MKFKQIISLLLVLTILSSVVCLNVSALTEDGEPEVYQGNISDTVFWAYDTGHTALHIFGEGELEVYGYENIPWNEFRPEITTIYIEEGITYICDNAFSFCHNLTEVCLPESLNYIGKGAFYECTQLREIVFPESLEYIGPYAFGYNLQLEHVRFPDSESLYFQIDESAFRNCELLHWAILPKNAIIGNMAFGFMEDGTQMDYFVIEGYEYSDAQRYAQFYGFEFVPRRTAMEGVFNGNIIWHIDEFTETLYIEGTGPLELMEEKAPWSGNKSLINAIKISEGIDIIGERVFYDIEADYIYLPDSLEIIGDYAFYRSTPVISQPSSKHIFFGDNVRHIGDYAFYGYGELEIELPVTVSYVGEKALGFYNKNGYTDPYGAPIDTKLDDLVVCGYIETEAHRYAVEHGITFVGLGDVDGDNMTTVLDTTYLQKHLVGFDEYSEMGYLRNMASDVNNDGVISITDGTDIQRFVAKEDTCFER